ncbi:zinc finger SWIM domain-containing protein 7-like [Macrobrachium rosenbergii]|uniref:zinc finger SWIM domain-containing protein 7-like n=1 Tax=Macrobrachium rosenbergii TaxID=79674 RepID=UPI0034D5CC19
MSNCPNTVSVVRGLISVVWQEYHSKGQLSEGVLNSLYCIFGNTLMKAFKIIDAQKVTKIISTSGRYIFQVTGRLDTPYYCLPYSVFCQCPAFKYLVIKKKETMCKHVLAAWLSSAMGVITKKKVSDEHLKDILENFE